MDKAESQAWFWTAEWQEGEAEADADIAAGRVTVAKSAEEIDLILGAPQIVADFRAVAQDWSEGTFTLLVLRVEDGREVWGDAPIPAATFYDIPAAAGARLQAPVAWRVAGQWLRDDGRWMADVERAPADPDETPPDSGWRV